MAVAHKDLTGINLHEPKGVASATAGSVYVANGAGSGTWTVLSIPEGTFTLQHKLYTSAGTSTWNKPANLMFVRVFLQGGGKGAAGGDGDGGTSSFGTLATAVGGGATLQNTCDINTGYGAYLPWAYANGESSSHGRWGLKVISTSNLPASLTVTVGAGTGASGAGLVCVEEYIQI